MRHVIYNNNGYINNTQYTLTIDKKLATEDSERNDILVNATLLFCTDVSNTIIINIIH